MLWRHASAIATAVGQRILAFLLKAKGNEKGEEKRRKRGRKREKKGKRNENEKDKEGRRKLMVLVI